MNPQAAPSPYELDFKQIYRNDAYWRNYLRPWISALNQKSKSMEKTNITLNGREMRTEVDVNEELERKGHDDMCPISRFSALMPILSTRGCVKGFHGLENNTAYESIRSADLAHRIHMQKLEKGIFDVEPLAPGIAAAGEGIAAAGKGFHVASWGAAIGVSSAGLGYGVGCVIKACKGNQ